MKVFILLLLSGIFVFNSPAQDMLLIPMDLRQSEHLKAYGIAYMALEKQIDVDWLLNYRGGSFLLQYHDVIARECRIRNVSFERISGTQAARIYAEVQREDANMDVVRCETPPKIAVYVPPGFQPWDDAVTLALEYAEIPYDKVFNKEVLSGDIYEYDWLHLHHEDFTGQYGKFYASYSNAPWYIEKVRTYERIAAELGFDKVSEMKLAVAGAIKEFIASGGFVFAMCSATDTFDIALAAKDVDIVDVMYNGTPPDPDFNEKLDFSQTLAFENFRVEENPLRYEFSNIDIPPTDLGPSVPREADYFTLFEFSAKHDPVPTMLTQNHVNVISGFMGQTTNFDEQFIKPHIVIMAKREGSREVKYLHGQHGRGTFSFYGGHDPEDYQHAVGDPPTDLSLYPNSPGYRLILNNVLFPAARPKPQKTEVFDPEDLLAFPGGVK
jgi:hypothetical protein